MDDERGLRLRTINQAAMYIREIDSETALTKTAIRRLVATGVLPSVRIGTKYLLSLDALDVYLEKNALNDMTPEGRNA